MSNQYTWDLSVFYNSFDDPQIEIDIAALQEKLNYAKELLSAPAATRELLEKYALNSEEISAISTKLRSFAGLTLSTDVSHEQAQKLDDKLKMTFMQLMMLNSAFVRLLKRTEGLDEIVASSEKLTQIKFYIDSARNDASHLMDEAAEKWIRRMSLSGGSAFGDLRSKLDATLMVDYRGTQIPLSAARGLAYDPDPQVRKDAYEAEIASYAKIEIPMAAALNGVKGESLTMAEAMHFDSVLARSLDSSNMEKETLDAMLTAMAEALPVFRKYLRRKGELLGHRNGLPFYDLFAPIARPGYTPKTYSIEEARAKLVEEMSKFTPDMGAFIDKAFADRWIDVFPKEGKGGGAFCSGMHHMDISRVLTNFTGSFSDVSTLAHELGHAWHNRCMKGLPTQLCRTPMPMAETASIFNETFLSHEVKKTATEAELLTYVEGDLMENTQVIVDIFSRYLFETDVIEGRKTHNLSVKELKELMLSAQDRTYGDGLDPDVRHPYMWACKSHYYSSGLAFYNFPYAFGQLFGKGVFAQYLEKGAAFVPVYNQLLRSSGSGTVEQVAASVGIDVRSVDFWRSSLKVITDEIELFLELTNDMI